MSARIGERLRDAMRTGAALERLVVKERLEGLRQKCTPAECDGLDKAITFLAQRLEEKDELPTLTAVATLLENVR